MNSLDRGDFFFNTEHTESTERDGRSYILEIMGMGMVSFFPQITPITQSWVSGYINLEIVV